MRNRAFWTALLFYIYIYIYIRLISLVGSVFVTGPGDLGSILGCVIPKTLKMVLDTSLLNTLQYKVRIKGKVEQSRVRSIAPPASQRRSCWKGSLLVALDYGHQLYYPYYIYTEKIYWTPVESILGRVITKPKNCTWCLLA